MYILHLEHNSRVVATLFDSGDLDYNTLRLKENLSTNIELSLVGIF